MFKINQWSNSGLAYSPAIEELHVAGGVDALEAVGLEVYLEREK